MNESAKLRLGKILRQLSEREAAQIEKKRRRLRADARFMEAFIARADVVIGPALADISAHLQAEGQSVRLNVEKKDEIGRSSILVNVEGLSEPWLVAALFSRPHVAFVGDARSRRVRIARSHLDLRSRHASVETHVPLHQLTGELVQWHVVDLLQELFE